VQTAILRVFHRYVLSIAHFKSICVATPQRANAGLIAIAETLGIGESEYHATIADDIERR
jgi:hypothetical protein